jgi:CubicO group peptidase (beta-lactamase class C family)
MKGLFAMSHRAARLVQALLALLLALSVVSAGAAPAAPPQQPSHVPTPAPGPIDPQELATFLDGVMPAQLETHHVPGAAVAVVQDGRLLLARGYGTADRERGVPVVADQTLFSVGSVGKTITWTAVMQLVEQGQLDLHADVNTYLTAFQVPATYPQPITLAHLLTHTAGFDDQAGILARSPADLQPLGAYLAANLPARVRPPGQLAAYSNHGTALAGYIVEQVSGLPYDQYVEERIFAPLQMRRSTTRVPVPAELAADLAAGYTYADGAYQRGEPEYLQVGPAGAMSATATDMAQFMLTHLQAGRSGEARLLQPATAAAMQQRQFSHDPRVSGLTYGFMEMTRNGQRLVWHGGDTELFHNLLVLLPDHNTGLFMTYNSTGGTLARMDLLTAVLNRYFPGPATDPAPAVTPAHPVDQVAGSYWPTRSHDTTWTKLRTLLRLVTVSATNDGSLTISGQVGLDPAVAQARWVEAEPLVYQQVHGEERLVFTTDAQGRVTHLFIGNFPIMAFTRLAWYETLPVQVGLLGGSLLLFLSALVGWPLGRLLARWRQRRRSTGARGGWRPAVWLLLAVSGLNVVFALGFAYEFQEYVARPYAASAMVLALLVLPLVTTVLTLGMVVAAVQAWRQRHWSLAARLHYSLVALAALAFIWWLSSWNLLGFRL